MASEGVLATLRAGWNALSGVAAPKAVIGGLALTAWNHARYTRDADVLLVSGDFQKEAVDRAVPWPALTDAGDLRVVQPDDLVVIKLLAGRLIDRADAAMLLRENREAIDFVRLHREVVGQGISAEYRQVWSDAFPSEPMPRLE
jgi:hypothetical protein